MEKSVSPNIVFVLTNNMREADADFMPFLKSLSTSEFSRAFVEYPLCSPSRATILTGQYSYNHSVMSNQTGYSGLNHDGIFPLQLQSVGYETAHFGEYLTQYGVFNNPAIPGDACHEVPLGWDEWATIVENDANYNDFALNENGTVVGYGNPSTACIPDSSTTSVYITDLLTQKAVKFIQDTSGPLYLQLCFIGPHAPNPALRHSGLFSNEPLPMPPNFNEADVSDKPSFIRSLPLLNSGQIQTLTDLYRRRLEVLQSVDEGIEEIFNALTLTGKLSNTVFVFMSDQGELFGEHRLTGLGSNYQESLNVPLFVYGYGSQNVDQLVCNVDIAQTFLEIAGTSPAAIVDGASFVPILNNPSTVLRTMILHRNTSPALNANYIMGQTLNFALLKHRLANEIELYDLIVDPFELENKFDTPGSQQIINSLVPLILQLMECSGNGCVQ